MGNLVQIRPSLISNPQAWLSEASQLQGNSRFKLAFCSATG